MAKKSGWSLRDIVVMAVVAVSLGVLWWAWTAIYSLAEGPLKAIHPGLSYLLVGVWFTGGTIIPFLIRRPGSALLGEVLAAGVQGLITQWGWTSLVWGLVQGGAAELAFASGCYKHYGWPTFAFAGFLSGAASYTIDFFWNRYGDTYSLETCLVQALACMVSGIVFGGLLGRTVGLSLSKTGLASKA